MHENTIIIKGVQTQPTPARLTKPPILHPISARTDTPDGRLRVFMPKTQRRQVKWQFSSPKPKPPNPTNVI